MVASDVATLMSFMILTERGVFKYVKTVSVHQSPLVRSSSIVAPHSDRKVQPPRLREWEETDPGSSPAFSAKNLREAW